MAGQLPQPAAVPIEAPTPPTGGARLAALLALLVLLGATLLQLYWAGSPNGKPLQDFAYTADHAYRHLAIARELTACSPAGATSCARPTPLAGSSSPVWSLALAGLMANLPCKCDVAMLPLAINLGAAALLVLIAGHLVSAEVRSGLWMFVLLVAMGAFMTLSLVVMSGMEYVLHACVMLLTIAAGIAVAQRDRPPVLPIIFAMVLAALNVGLGYEGLAVLVALVLWGGIQGHMLRQLFLLVGGLAAVLATGLYLSQHGAGWVPMPVLANWRQLSGTNWGAWPEGMFAYARQTVVLAPAVWGMLLIAAALLGGHRASVRSADPAARTRAGWLFVFVVVAFAYLLLGRIGDHRCEAYLIPIGVVAIARTLAAMVGSDRLRQAASAPSVTAPAMVREGLIDPAPARAARQWGNGLIVALCVAPVLVVASPYVEAFATSWQMARDASIRERLTASFVRTYFPAGPVVTYDVGVVAYETNARVVDAKDIVKPGVWDEGCSPGAATQPATQAQVVLLIGCESGLLVPKDWKLIGGWHRKGAQRGSASAVRVYSVSDAMALDVKTALRQSSVAEQRPVDVEYWFADQQSAPATKPARLPRVPDGSTGMTLGPFGPAKLPAPPGMSGDCSNGHGQTPGMVAKSD